jgi:hypothetical protein
MGFFIFLCFLSQAQEQNVRSKILRIESDTIRFDSVFVSPTDFKLLVQNELISDTLYKVIYTEALLVVSSQLLGKEVEIKYRIFPTSLTKVYSNKSKSLMLDSLKKGEDPWVNFAYSYDDNPFAKSSGGLVKTGSISRGITVGNNQDLAVNSNLNLQLSGKLTDNLNVAASITDDNIPIQPQGNTQQLQDFDQVYIQLFNDRHRLTAGDLWLNSQRSNYLKYNKRGQGGLYQQEYGKKIFTGDSATIRTTAGLAASKGKYSRNIIPGVEGNQGPYRLTGAESERFIVIMAGTERVFIDGVELKRGQEYDYIIDYNLAQIVFTPRQMITKDKRIVVEFQYSDKNYARSMIEVSHEIQSEKLNASFRIFSEQDSKNQPLQLNLDDPERIETLVNAGDDFSKMFFSGVDTTLPFSNDIIFYRKVDSLGYTVYVRSTNPEVAKYQVNFSEVGEGKGNYIEDQFSAIGRVYKWIKPDTLLSGDILPRGKFEPIVILVSPKKQQMFTSSFDYKLGKGFKIFSEGAISVNDLNTFSKLDSEDDVAFAGKIGFIREPEKISTNKYQLKAGADLEFIQDEFVFIERFREVEFERNWNIQNLAITTDQLLGNGFVGVSDKTGSSITAMSSIYHADTLFSGVKNGVNLNYKRPKHNVRYNGSHLSSSSNINNTSFYRHKAYLDKTVGKLTFGYLDETETNLFFDARADTLLPRAYSFYAWEAFVKTSDTAKHVVSVFFKDRIDKSGKLNELSSNSKAQSFGIDYNYRADYRNVFKTRLEYRELIILDSTLITIQPENTIVGRIDYGATWYKGAINLNMYYEIGTGLEQKLEFLYLEVLPGQGNFQWVDYNGDGVKDINEFEVAQFADQANYIRIFTPSNQFIKVFNNQFSYVMNLNPQAVFYNKEGLKKVLSKLSNQTSITSNRKTNGDFTRELYNPFFYEIEDITLSSLSSSLRNVFFINRSGSKFGTEYIYQNSGSKLLLTSGFDTRNVESHEVRTRFNFLTKFELNIGGILSDRLNLSEYAAQRDYQIQQQELNARFSFQPSTKFRAEAHSEFKDKRNSPLFGPEAAQIFLMGTTLKFNAQNKGLFQLEFSRIFNSFTGERNTPLEFEMLEGLKIGENYTWQLSVQRKVAKSLQLTINYNGRKSPENNAVHYGGVQVRAYF